MKKMFLFLSAFLFSTIMVIAQQRSVAYESQVACKDEISEHIQTRYIADTVMTITVNTPGTMGDQFVDLKDEGDWPIWSGLSNVKIIGTLNGDDLRTMRILHNRWDDCFNRLDMSDCNIVKGGGPYFDDYYITEDNVLGYCALPSGDKELILPNTLKGWNTFDQNRPESNKTFIGRHTLIIGDSLRYLPVMWEPSIQTFQVSENNPYLSSLEGVLFNKDKSILLTHPRVNKKYFSEGEFNRPKHYVVPEGVREIGDYAFYNTPVTEIDIPEGVVSIGYRAFVRSYILSDEPADLAGALYYRIALDWLPNSLEYIGSEAFKHIANEFIILPPNVKHIGSNAFLNWYDRKQYNKWDGVGILYSASPVPPECEPNKYNRGPFGSIINYNSSDEILVDDRHKCLYVPKGSKSAYEQAFGWGYDYFEEIIEVEDVMAAAQVAIAEAVANGIPALNKDKDRHAWETARYNLQGQFLCKPTKGWNIVRYSDGSTQKVFVK